jgi:hypothetical protein
LGGYLIGVLKQAQADRYGVGKSYTLETMAPLLTNILPVFAAKLLFGMAHAWYFSQI